ncbi:hypothetical protein Fmac_007340 [Flemingia macrophylla]|uniref:Uncharacterized protein n=1 Tax=Flemingia macrophylla TaxID=520843 RepID=A0ABD1MUA2_9FABA
MNPRCEETTRDSEIFYLSWKCIWHLVRGIRTPCQVGFHVGSHVWIEDPEVAWIDGEIQESNKDEITVVYESGSRVVSKSANIYPKDPEFPPNGVEDMTRLAYLHEPGVLQNLHVRYAMNEIYTYTGNILIAVNPFQRLPHLTETSTMAKYKGAAFGEQSPHPFAIASSAYSKMINEEKSQSILVSGESGAGKTESTKMLMHYLAFLGGRAATEGRSVEQQVLESNPVLEAFGNAKTVRNNNSRQLVQLFPDVGKYKLGNPRKFHYLNQSNCIELDGVDDSKEYIATKRAMEVVGISSDDQDAIFRIVAAVLHLGNIEFVKGGEEELDSSQPKDENSNYHLKTAAELLMCDEKSLEDSFCKRVMVTRGDTITKSLDPTAAALSRDALAKIIYSRLFDWIVDKINNSIGQDPDSKNLIGVLDIYGFESFKTNSFEQFCINLTNEKLQQHFNQHVFKMEQEEYSKEEIDWSYIEFVDNQDVLDLIEKKPGGVIALLDEACMFPRSTHETFAEKLYQTFKDNKRFSKPKLSRTDFTINHYAGDVTYQTDFFLDKNKDYVVPEHAALLSASKCPFVAGLFPPLPEETTKSTKFSSIATQFKQQLQSLLETLNATEPHYIRCVKPNNLLKPGIFENNNVLQQLRCGGVMEAIRISCAGYPTRKSFDEFVRRFTILEPKVLKACPDEMTACKRLLDRANLKDYQIGKTKVFLRAGQMAELDACRAEVLGRSASVIQRKVRTFLCRKHFILLQFSATELQRVARGQLAQHRYECMRREAASLKIQKDFRMYISRTAYKTICATAICIQTGMRGMAARNDLRFRKRTQASIVIQAAREAKALEAAKLNLEKQVEELTLSLETEQRMREAKTQENEKLQHALQEMELQFQETKAAKTQENEKLQHVLQELELQLQETKEAKTQENDKLQKALQEMELQFQETKAALIQEQEAAKKVAEENSTIQENSVNVVDNELINKLTAENEKLKELVNSLEKKTEQVCPANDTDNELINKLSSENQHLKELINSLEKKTAQEIPVNVTDNELINKLTSENEHLKERINSLEKKTTLEIPFNFTENEVINKLTAENEQLKEQVNSLEKKIDETERKYEECSKLSEERMSQIIETESKMIEIKTNMQRLEEKLSDMETENQVLRQQTLLSSSSRRMSEKSSPATTLPAENGTQAAQGSVPAKTFGVEDKRRSIMERHQDPDNNDCMAYWLSNTSSLFFHLQRCLRVPTARKPPTPTTFFGRMTQGFRSSNSLSSSAFDVVHQVDAKYPALLFKQQLAAYVEKIYGIVRENFKKELSPLLSSCIQVDRSSKDNSQPTGSWVSTIECLNKYLKILKDNYVPPVLVQKLFNQIFQYINVEIFNSLLLHSDCCTFKNGDYKKSGLAELEVWCNEATEEYIGSSLDELKHANQAVRFLVAPQKAGLSYDDLTNDLCPVLSAQQLHRICTLYCDDDDETQKISPDVTTRLKLLMTDDAEEDDKSFLMEDNSSVPIIVEEIPSSAHDKTVPKIKPPAELIENANFQFLHDYS